MGKATRPRDMTEEEFEWAGNIGDGVARAKWLKKAALSQGTWVRKLLALAGVKAKNQDYPSVAKVVSVRRFLETGKPNPISTCAAPVRVVPTKDFMERILRHAKEPLAEGEAYYPDPPTVDELIKQARALHKKGIGPMSIAVRIGATHRQVLRWTGVLEPDFYGIEPEWIGGYRE